MSPTFAWLYYAVIIINIAGVIMNEVTRRRLKRTRAIYVTALEVCEVAYAQAIDAMEKANKPDSEWR